MDRDMGLMVGLKKKLQAINEYLIEIYGGKSGLVDLNLNLRALIGMDRNYCVVIPSFHFSILLFLITFIRFVVFSLRVLSFIALAFQCIFFYLVEDVGKHS